MTDVISYDNENIGPQYSHYIIQSLTVFESLDYSK